MLQQSAARLLAQRSLVGAATPCLRALSSAAGAQNEHAEREPCSQDPLVGEVLRSGMVAEGAAARLFQGQQCVLGRRPDVAAFRERDQQHLERLRKLAPGHRVRPSLLAPLASAGFFALGAASAVLPQRLKAAVAGGLQEALTDVYNDDLRRLREAGVSEAAPEVREAVKACRDEDRSVEGGPQVPDITTLLANRDRLKDITLEEGVAAVVKFGTAALVNASRQL